MARRPTHRCAMTTTRPTTCSPRGPNLPLPKLCWPAARLPICAAIRPTSRPGRRGANVCLAFAYYPKFTISTPFQVSLFQDKLAVRGTILGSLAAGLLLLSSCGKGESEAEAAKEAADAPPQVPVVALRTTDQRLYHEHVADIQAERNVEVRAKVRGFLDHIFVDEGKFVKKGQPLFQINPSEYQNQLASARAAETSAEAEVASALVSAARALASWFWYS
ncbi:MAG: biotin/lipoyl-binding protein, partial [Cytophagaceae bacterium]